ncbi:hypothetical protein [Maribacter sp. R77961]|uniref:hypothetical protein n=1 Tax=Maribacter sp. R77961 TaxID=3093871 RepID=UPI0037C5798D
MLKGVIVALYLVLSCMSYGQNNINDYKYIIVPKKFDVFKETNAHKTSTLVKYLLDQKGFPVIYDDALPDELNKNRCLGLLVSLVDDSSMFATKTIITFEDCEGELVFKTLQGKSRSKVYKEAYTEAIKESMRSFDQISYTYEGKSEATEPITVSFKNDVKKLPEHSETSTKDAMVKESVVKSNTERPMVVQEATTENQFYESKEPVASDIKMAENPAPKKLKIRKPNKEDILYAQSLPNGYQLVDSAPKIRMRLLKSSKDNIYMVKEDSKNGIVYLKDDKWIFEYYEGDKLMQKELNIKF